MNKIFILIILMLILILMVITPQIYKQESNHAAQNDIVPMVSIVSMKPIITYDPELVLICSNPNIVDNRCDAFVEKLRSDSSIIKRILDDLPDQESRDKFIKTYKPLLDQNSKLGKLNDNMQTTTTRIKNARQLILDIKQEQHVSPPQK